jgi:hypothetical protein
VCEQDLSVRTDPLPSTDARGAGRLVLQGRHASRRQWRHHRDFSMKRLSGDKAAIGPAADVKDSLIAAVGRIRP